MFGANFDEVIPNEPQRKKAIKKVPRGKQGILGSMGNKIMLIQTILGQGWEYVCGEV